MPTALPLIALPPEGGQRIFDVTRPNGNFSVDSAVTAIASAVQTSPINVTWDYVKLATGPGRISFPDYMKLRLFDEQFYAGHDRKEVVGQRRNSNLVLTVNYRHDLMGLFSNKVAAYSYLSAHGFTTPSIAAIYIDGLSADTRQVLSSPVELRSFLENAENYPLFCKPVDGCQSLGSISLKSYQSDIDSVEAFDGRLIAIDHFIADVREHYRQGYLFQRHLMPHSSIRKICGDRLATLRIVTMMTESGPKVFRVCWKIPAGANSADNYWRSQNLLASIEPTTWRVGRVMSGTGLNLRFHQHHPDTGEALIGIPVPGAEIAANAVIEAARLMRELPLIGWDVAVLESGAAIIDMNEKPDFFLNQLADGCGVLGAELSQLLAAQEKNAAVRTKALRLEAREL